LKTYKKVVKLLRRGQRSYKQVEELFGNIEKTAAKQRQANKITQRTSIRGESPDRGRFDERRMRDGPENRLRSR